MDYIEFVRTSRYLSKRNSDFIKYVPETREDADKMINYLEGLGKRLSTLTDLMKLTKEDAIMCVLGGLSPVSEGFSWESDYVPLLFKNFTSREGIVFNREHPYYVLNCDNLNNGYYNLTIYQDMGERFFVGVVKLALSDIYQNLLWTLTKDFCSKQNSFILKNVRVALAVLNHVKPRLLSENSDEAKKMRLKKEKDMRYYDDLKEELRLHSIAMAMEQLEKAEEAVNFCKDNGGLGVLTTWLFDNRCHITSSGRDSVRDQEWYFDCEFKLPYIALNTMGKFNTGDTMYAFQFSTTNSVEALEFRIEDDQGDILRSFKCGDINSYGFGIEKYITKLIGDTSDESMDSLVSMYGKGVLNLSEKALLTIPSCFEIAENFDEELTFKAIEEYFIDVRSKLASEEYKKSIRLSQNDGRGSVQRLVQPRLFHMSYAVDKLDNSSQVINIF